MGLVEVGRRGPAGIVTLSGEDSGNRLSSAMARDIVRALREVQGLPRVRAVVLQGGVNFCVGADLKERVELAPEDWPEHHAAFERLAEALQDVPQPTIAAVRGWALGGGAELALGCDIVVAAPGARFGQPEALRGLVPGMGAPQFMQRRLPHGMAAYLLYTGAPVDAVTAERLGLVTFIDQDPEAQALVIAEEIAKASPTAVRSLRRLLKTPPAGFAASYRAEIEAWRLAVASGDALEGAKAFAEKRPAAFAEPK